MKKLELSPRGLRLCTNPNQTNHAIEGIKMSEQQIKLALLELVQSNLALCGALIEVPDIGSETVQLIRDAQNHCGEVNKIIRGASNEQG